MRRRWPAGRGGRLPLADQGGGKARNPGLSLSGRRVLVVEDDYLIAQDIVRRFRAAGAEIVGPAPTVEQALTLVAGTERLDGAVLDINLREEMAYPVADALLARGVPLVFATGYDAGTIPARYADVPCCEKPTPPERVAKALFG